MDTTNRVNTREPYRATLVRGQKQRAARRKPTTSKLLISLAIISYIISNQIFMTAVLSSIKLFSATSCTADQIGLKSGFGGRSLIQLAAANPAPAPLKVASARSSSSHRVPPVNGSMFGKRDLASSLASTSQPRGSSTSEVQAYNEIITGVIEKFMASNTEGKSRQRFLPTCFRSARVVIYQVERREVLAIVASRLGNNLHTNRN